MSRIGKVPIALPSNVKVDISSSNFVTVSGPKGSLSRQFHPEIKFEIDGQSLKVTRPSESNLHKSLHGLSRTLLSNMVTGVTAGFTKTLEINGVGYRAAKVGKNLVLQLGYSHPVEVNPPESVDFTVDGTTKVIINGIDKQVVGEIAAQIRGLRKPEPYKGKGIKYENEVIRRKAGKAGKVGGKKK